MRVLLVGAHGFIGGYVADALRTAGHEVIACVRRPNGEGEIAGDLARDHDEEVWLPRLRRIDAVVNCAGILREAGLQTFEAIHVSAPLALFRACVRAGVRKVVQISALGEDVDGEFIASKHRADAALSELDLDWTILRPGLVYSAAGSYGGTSLLRALAVLPGVMFLPQQGAQKLRPVAAEDVGDGVVAALERPSASRAIIELVGPDAVAFVDYQRAWRAWFGLQPGLELRMPRMLVAATVAVGEALTRGPVCSVIWNLLRRERIGSIDAVDRMRALLGIEPRSLDRALAQRPCRAGDLQAARLHMQVPALRVAFALLWIFSGCVGIFTTATAAQAAVPGWPPDFALALARVSGAADIALGALLLGGWRVRLIQKLMLAMLVCYTIGIGLLAPQHWFDPFGGLLKNIALIFALALLLALEIA